MPKTSEKDKRILNTLLTRVREAELAKGSKAAEMQRNIAFFYGRQWIRYSSERGWYNATVPRWRSAITINYFQPITLLVVSKLVQNKPGWEAMPWTDTEKDLLKAQGSEKLLEFLWDRMRMQPRLAKAVFYSFMCGHVGFHTRWAKKGYGGFKTEIRSPDGGQVIDTIYHGEPRTEIVSAFDLGIDPYADDDDDIGWIYRQRWVHKSFLREFETKAKEGDTGVARGMNNRWEDSGAFQEGNDPDDYVVLYEMYSKDDDRYYVFTLNRLIKHGKWEGDYPIRLYRMMDSMGDLRGSKVAGNAMMGRPMASVMAPPQMELNKSASQVLEYKDQTIHPRWLATKGHHLDAKGISKRPNSVIEYKYAPGYPPREVHPKPLPQYIVNMAAQMKETMQELVGVHEISLGQAPGSVQTGRGLAILAEADQSKWGPPSVALSDVLTDVGRMILRLWKDNAPEQLTFRVMGENSQLEVHMIHRDGVLSEDVRVQPGSTFSYSKQLYRDRVMEAWQLGAIDEPGTLLREIGLGNLSSTHGSHMKHRNRAKRENMAMYRGDTPKIEIWDDHLIHMEEVIQVVTSVIFDEMAPDRQELFRAHYNEHYQSYMQVMQANQQAASQRGVSSAGGAGAPEEAPPSAQTAA